MGRFMLRMIQQAVINAEAMSSFRARKSIAQDTHHEVKSFAIKDHISVVLRGRFGVLNTNIDIRAHK